MSTTGNASRRSLTVATSTAPELESAVRGRYAAASQQHEACLCVPTRGYDPAFLKAIPQEIIDRDYGCGDPSRHVREGETVLDLGSGGGKICYICAQKVGPAGRVIGVDFNQPMLDLARRHRQSVADRLGYLNTSFRKGKIQDLRLDLDLFEQYLAEHPVRSADDYLRASDEADRLRRTAPLVADESVDVIVSNCVLNLVRPADKRQLFDEMFRVLKPGGRCVISDVVADEDVPQPMQDDPDLWSGCISGAFREDVFLKMFEDAGFHGMHLLERSDTPWQTVKGIEFRSVTVAAFKGTQGPGHDHRQAVIYKGPWRTVTDDDGHTLERGCRTAVGDETFRLYQREPYRDQFYFVEPLTPVDPAAAAPFDRRGSTTRHPRETKGLAYDKTTDASTCCGPDGCC